MTTILLLLILVNGKPTSQIIEFNNHTSCLKSLNDLLSMEQKESSSQVGVLIKARCLSKGN